jgi:hypothetical protein
MSAECERKVIVSNNPLSALPPSPPQSGSLIEVVMPLGRLDYGILLLGLPARHEQLLGRVAVGEPSVVRLNFVGAAGTRLRTQVSRFFSITCVPGFSRY